MTFLAETAACDAITIPCPGPVPTSAEHAARCRACGRCAAIASLFDIGETESETDFNGEERATTFGRTPT